MRPYHCMKLLIAALIYSVLTTQCLGLRRRLQATLTGPAPDVASFQRAGCDNFTSNKWEPLRPAYHLTVPYGWMNDPHGMFELNGTTHVFMQYNPRAIQWGAPFWAHVVSTDLAHWTWLPPALLPDTMYDFNGVWSGAATVPEESGIPILTYTGASTLVPEQGNFFQRQAMAVPEDMSDPLLKRWKKPDTNPFLVQVAPGGTNFQFRDPTEGRHAVWLAMTSSQNPQPMPKSYFALAIGTQQNCLGGAGIFTAPTMAGPWSYAGNLFNQLDAEPEVNGQCRASRTASNTSWPGPAYGGPCDQFGAYCRMWEVVDMAELEPGLFMLKWDDQSHFRGVFSLEWYVLGNGPWDFSAVNPRASSAAEGDRTNTAAGSASRTPVFGQQYSDYPNTSTSTVATAEAAGAAAAANATAAAASEAGQQQQQQQRLYDNDFNFVNASDESVSRSLFRGELDGQRYAPMRMDYGSVYASMVWRTSDMRQVMLSWIMDTAAGCSGSCSDQLPDVIERMGFKSAQTLPRVVTYEPLTKTLRLYPVNETSLLRGQQVFNATQAPVAASPNLTLIIAEGIVENATTSGSAANTSTGNSAAPRQQQQQPTARQFEVQLNFTLQPPAILLEAPSASDPGTGSAPFVAPESPGNATVVSSNSTGSNAAAAGNATATPSGSGSNAAAGKSGLARKLQQQQQQQQQPPPPGEFTLGLRILTGSSTYTDVYLRGLLFESQAASSKQGAAAAAAATIGNLSVWVDKTHAGNSSNTTFIEGGPVPLPVNASQAWVVPQQPLGLSVFVDHSVIEVYALGGLARVSSRIYPEGDDVAWGLAVWSTPPTLTVGSGGGASGASGASGAATGGAWGVLMNATVWEMQNAWLPPEC